MPNDGTRVAATGAASSECRHQRRAADPVQPARLEHRVLRRADNLSCIAQTHVLHRSHGCCILHWHGQPSSVNASWKGWPRGGCTLSRPADAASLGSSNANVCGSARRRANVRGSRPDGQDRNVGRTPSLGPGYPDSQRTNRSSVRSGPKGDQTLGLSRGEAHAPAAGAPARGRS